MASPSANDDGPLAAGEFGSWVSSMQAALQGHGESDVPCGGCTACCTSSQFVHIEPDEVETKSRIPAELLFPAPQLPRGHVLLGYDERGHCPMLADGRCTIYEDRPRACRVYDCRIFAAAAVPPPEGRASAIDRQARRWRFDYATGADRVRHDAVKTAAAFIGEHAGELGGPSVGAGHPTRLAILAIEQHELFLRTDETTGRITTTRPPPDEVRVALTRRRVRPT